ANGASNEAFIPAADYSAGTNLEFAGLAAVPTCAKYFAIGIQLAVIIDFDVLPRFNFFAISSVGHMTFERVDLFGGFLCCFESLRPFSAAPVNGGKISIRIGAFLSAQHVK